MSRSKIHFVVQALPAKDVEFREKLQTLSQKRSFYAPFPDEVPSSLQELQQYEIKQCVVGPKHFAFLLEDGRVCRLKYTAQDSQEEDVKAEPAPSVPAPSKSSATKTGERPAKVPRTGGSPWIFSGTDLSSGNTSALRRWGTHIGVIRSMASSSSGSSSSTTSASTTSSRNRGRNNGGDSLSSLVTSSAGVRLVRTSQLRGRGLQNSLLTGQRVIVPASHVPEELVNQVQGILQGKSRSIIIRELQRTNLDVNLAVNNLLSRDDEDNDDMDDNGNDYMPGEDLLSLLDSGIPDHGVFIDTDTVLPEELLSYTLHRASRTSSGQRGGGTAGGESGSAGGRDSVPDRDPIIRLRSPRFFEPLCSYESDQDEPSQQSKSSLTSAKKTKVGKKTESVNVGEELEWWMEEDDYAKFIQIGAMQSELAAVDTIGRLRQWRWSKASPFSHPTNPKFFHPRAQFLGLEDTKVVHLAACSLRASVLVESGGVATWIDESVARHASMLEHSVTSCVTPDAASPFNSPKHKSTRQKCLHVCSLYTALFTPSGDLYWWGVLPFHLRKKVLEKAQSKYKKTLSPKKSSGGKKTEVKVGSLVCLHSCPMFQAGAIAIHARGGKPKVGCLQQSAWNLTDKCFFKVLKSKGKKTKGREKEKRKLEKMDSTTKEQDQKAGTNTSENTSDVAPMETPVIQSNSERETVLKSTSSAGLVQPTAPTKPQKRKLPSSTTKPSKNPDPGTTSKGDKEEDPGCDDAEEDTLEQWNLQDVIFIEDAQTVPVGKVLKVDGDMVAVMFTKSGKFSTEKMDKQSIWKNLRLLRKDDVHVLTSTTPPKVPDCFLKRKLALGPASKIHAICANELGIEAIEEGADGGPLNHVTISMLGKISTDPLPTPAEMFFAPDGDAKRVIADESSADHEDKICNLDRNCQDFVTIFRDCNSCLYPLLRNENFGIRDPRWINLTPVTAVGVGTHVSTDLQQKDKSGDPPKPKTLVVSALVFKSYLAMPLIICRDRRGVQHLLDNVTPDEVKAICEERCDGQRNILHVAVSITAPNSNQNHEEEEREDKDSSKKDLPKRESYRSLAAAVSTLPTATSTTESRDSSTSRPSSATSTSSRNSGGAHSMSQNERDDAVNAIANAISVVTRGERSTTEPRPLSRTNSRDQHNPYSTASDPFILPVSPLQYRPLMSLPSMPSTGFSSRFMRDIMQQFAAVLDDRPASSATSTTPSTTPATSSHVTTSTARRIPTIIQETRQSGPDEPMETMPSPYRLSPTPAIPTPTWPPDQASYATMLRQQQRNLSLSREEGLNLSVSEGSGTTTTSSRYSNKTPSKKPKRKRSLTPPSAEIPKPPPKRGTPADALAIIKTLCSANALQGVMLSFLSQRDTLGHTPFMSAIYHRAYPAALDIFSQAQSEAQAKGDSQEVFMSMIYPKGSEPDANPLYVLCTNDTCSFTWTGAQHINQDIFECWTCGLTETLCCCSECARVCHNGHDCKLKRTSPTAYCDCWEKCACRSLVPGDQDARGELLKKLLFHTKLVDLANSRGETMLQFLAHTVARQTIEQRQHRSRNTASSRSNRAAKTTIAGVEYDVPQHDLQPPTFCRDAFLVLLHNWNSVRSTVMSNCPGHTDPHCASSLLELSSSDANSVLLPEEQQCMASQTGTSRLDSFTLCLLVKCNTMYLDALLETFINQVQKMDKGTDKNKDSEVVHRFVRSLVRIFVVLSVCSNSEYSSGKSGSRTSSSTQPLKRIQRAFSALIPMAVRELCEMSVALIDPVRMGVARPTSPFSVLGGGTEVIHSCETAFARLPFPPRNGSGKKKDRERARDRQGRSKESSPTFRVMGSLGPRPPRPISIPHITRRGLSHHRSQTTGSPRVSSGPAGGSADRDSGRVARDAEHEDYGDDFVRIARHVRTQEATSLLEDRILESYHPVLTDEDEEDDGREWQNEEEPAENPERPTGSREESSSQSAEVVEESHGDETPVQDSSQTENALQHPDEADQDGTEENPPAAESQQEMISEGDLDVDDEDADDKHEEEDHGDHEDNPHEDEESDMDLTLLAGTDVDTDPESGGEEHENNADDNAERRERQSGILYLEEDEGVSEDIGDEDEDDQDDDDEEEDGQTYTKTSEDEAATATEPEEEDGSSQEEEEEDANEEDENDQEDEEEGMDAQSEMVEYPLERAPTRQQRSRAANAPHSMRWALGGSRPNTYRSGPSSFGNRPPGPSSAQPGGSLIYIDPLSIRRTNTAGVSSSATSSGPSGGDSKQNVGSGGYSTAVTNAQLARAFGICVREVGTLLTIVWQSEHIANTPLSTFLELTYEDIKTMKDFVEDTLSETWKWLLTVVDSTEAQLRYGEVLSLGGSPDHVDHPLYKGPAKPQGRDGGGRSPMDRRGAITAFSRSAYPRTGRDINSDSSNARQDFLSYILSLMRAHSGEHADYLPIMDVSSMRHVAYVLDALIFFLRETSALFDEDMKEKSNKNPGQRPESERKYVSSLNLGYENTDDEEDEEADAPPPVQESSGISDEFDSLDVIVDGIIANAREEVDPVAPYAHPEKTFFRRSDSMTFLGCTDPDPFNEPLVKALPLADKPHLLQPNARKEELFGRPRRRMGGAEDPSFFDPDLPGTGMGQLRHKIPAKFQKLEEIRAERQLKKQSMTNTGTQTEVEKVESSSSAETAASFQQPASEGKEQSKETVPMDTTEGSTKRVIVKTEGGKNVKKIKPGRKSVFTPPPVDSLLGRCRLTLELFTKVFLDDVGAEPKSILQELGGFEVRESKFRKEMEKLRNSQSVDLQLNVEREPHRLITQTFKQLNQHFRRRAGSSFSSSSLSATLQPLAVQRVKVVFKDEPGEGSGVARSFYTALCEALLSSNKLPPLDSILVPLGSSSSRSSGGIHHALVSRLRKREQERDRTGRAGGKKVSLRSYFLARYAQRSMSPSTGTGSTWASPSPQLSVVSPAFYKQSGPPGDGSGPSQGSWSRDKRAIGERLLPRVNAINPGWSKKITGMLLGLPVSELLLLLSSENLLKNKVRESSRRLALVRYNGDEEDPNASSSKETQDSSSNESAPPQQPRRPQRSAPKPPSSSSPSKDKDGKDQESESDHDSEGEEVDVSTFPLFYQPGKRGFYSPASYPTPKKSHKTQDSDPKATKKALPLGYEARLNAFRNVGRIIGLCLLQNELCPLPLNRHVLKALLGRKINWHDFAFFDPVMYESMRFVLAESEGGGDEDLLGALELTFVANPLSEEGGGEVELLPGGADVSVTGNNLRDYVRRYATYRMITCCHKAIQKMREGLFDVLPPNALDGLTAEDLRLLANGCGRVNVRTLISYTSFNDESGKSAGSAEKLTEFKRWFWSVVERMGHSARQELLYFWTGSPALPASEDGFQPMPTVTIRPPDDQHLPSANTCISRLYVPLYSSRAILKQKLLVAIKTKNFGFV